MLGQVVTHGITHILQFLLKSNVKSIITSHSLELSCHIHKISVACNLSTYIKLFEYPLHTPFPFNLLDEAINKLW